MLVRAFWTVFLALIIGWAALILFLPTPPA